MRRLIEELIDKLRGSYIKQRMITGKNLLWSWNGRKRRETCLV